MKRTQFYKTKETLAYKAEKKIKELVSKYHEEIKLLSSTERRKKDIKRADDIKQIHQEFLSDLKELVIKRVNKPEYNFIIENLIGVIYEEHFCSLKKCESDFLYSNRFTSIFNKRE